MTFIIVRCHTGPLPINDIYAAGNSGDLVTIKEADGSTQIFTVPYSSVPLAT
ncbi:fimbria/pilus outer membrane usher protein [Escherichia coli]